MSLSVLDEDNISLSINADGTEATTQLILTVSQDITEHTVFVKAIDDELVEEEGSSGVKLMATALRVTIPQITITVPANDKLIPIQAYTAYQVIPEGTSVVISFEATTITAGDSVIMDLSKTGDDKSQVTKHTCLLYTSPSPRDRQKSRMPSSA